LVRSSSVKFPNMWPPGHPIIILVKKDGFSSFPKEGLQFLRSLKRNNKREWFQERKSIYETHIKRPWRN
jgi:hypothetical protein